MIIGLCGLAGAGKDTVARVLVKERGFTQHAFADDLRKALYALNPIIGGRWIFWIARLRDVVDRYGWDVAKRRYPEVRRSLQALGGEVGRDQWGEHFWRDRVFAKCGANDNVVISDVRYPNEVDAIHERGGMVIWVLRPGIGKMSHKSEQMDFGSVCDAIVRNDRDIESLRSNTLACVGYVGYLDAVS